MQPEFKNSHDAFQQAINEGRLSTDPKAPNYAGHYMYMGPSLQAGKDAFKHIQTRQYLPQEPAKCQGKTNFDWLAK